MAGVSTYLNFPGTTEEAFTFYRDLFGTEFQGPIVRIGDMPPQPGMPTLAEADLAKIMHIELPILGGHVLMATDMLESMGQTLRIGNNTTINLTLDTRAETERLYAALSAGATDCAPLSDHFWGYWGCCLDRFGIRWMFNCTEPKPE
jgi:PhnB protein